VKLQKAVKALPEVIWQKWTSSQDLYPECSTPLYFQTVYLDTDLKCVHTETSDQVLWSLSGLNTNELNREKGYLLPTWARKITCQVIAWQVIFQAQFGI